MFMPRPLRMSAVLAVTLALAACGDDSAKKEAKASEPTTAQAEIIKYNQYVDTANSISTTFGEALDRYETHAVPALKDGKPLKDFVISNDSTILRTKDKLDKALAMQTPIAEIDAPAKEFSDALGKLAPLSNELQNYSAAKTFLSDQGALAREKSPAYVAALTEVVKAENGFYRGISIKDTANTKQAFEKAEKDSVAYYRAGLVYYGKSTMNLASGVFEGKGLGAEQGAFKQELDKMNEMALGFDKKTREADPKGCSSLMMNVNSFLASGRKILENTDNGRYKEDAARTGAFKMMRPTIETDGNSLRQDFNNMISSLNLGRC
ncbi:DUF3829 domain-containing protein [Achromobacter anxifer]|jgi:hypothetical protein|uniref:DUF3829 domain-containing protein n=2 Tax=Achromobacter anxifer TaxID=1287737 RepID=A0A6S7F370_9BURK|nr:DUF3829 domain-containing protein [Achromobacter anxifer]MDF8360994.1 DUF3829 domain-containing protein [Achromobacter anxifer]CAB3928038.1 hypothetical protein LMG26858_06130 [Achromobacter anxifer]CAB5517599.1 hypothetical protein LMG26857_06695 [Achromobacter anxifer]